MYIDGNTHYCPLLFIAKVSHPGKGYLKVTPDRGDIIRFGEPVPGKVATYYRDGKKIRNENEPCGAAASSHVYEARATSAQR